MAKPVVPSTEPAPAPEPAPAEKRAQSAAPAIPVVRGKPEGSMPAPAMGEPFMPPIVDDSPTEDLSSQVALAGIAVPVAPTAVSYLPRSNAPRLFDADAVHEFEDHLGDFFNEIPRAPAPPPATGRPPPTNAGYAMVYPLHGAELERELEEEDEPALVIPAPVAPASFGTQWPDAPVSTSTFDIEVVEPSTIPTPDQPPPAEVVFHDTEEYRVELHGLRQTMDLLTSDIVVDEGEIAEAMNLAKQQLDGGSASSIGSGALPAPEPEIAGKKTTLFGRYLLVSPLYKTDAGDLHTAYELQDDGGMRPCVLRRLFPSKAAVWKTQRARFISEAALAIHLDHPGLAKVYDCGEHEGMPFIAREVVEGLNLRVISALTAGSGLALPAVLAIGQQVAEALAYAHCAADEGGALLHLVHGALSTSDVLVGRNGVVKLTEIGCGYFDGKPLPARSGGRAGRPGYMAPEQKRGGAADQRTDCFSLGMVLVEMLGGLISPSDLRDPADGVPQCVRDLLSTRHDLPPRLGVLLERMTAVDRERRIGSADDVAETLASILSELPPWAGLEGELEPIFERVAPLSRPGHASLPAGELLPIPQPAVLSTPPIKSGGSRVRSWSFASLRTNEPEARPMASPSVAPMVPTTSVGPRVTQRLDTEPAEPDHYSTRPTTKPEQVSDELMARAGRRNTALRASSIALILALVFGLGWLVAAALRLG